MRSAILLILACAAASGPSLVALHDIAGWPAWPIVPCYLCAGAVLAWACLQDKEP